MIEVLPTFTIVCYLGFRFLNKPMLSLALLSHSLLLYLWINSGSSPNLSALNIFSVICWATCTIACFSKHASAAIITAPICCASILLAWLIPENSTLNGTNHPIILLHIILGIITVINVSLAGIQAVLIIIMEKWLKQPKLSALAEQAPPLQSLEAGLHQKTRSSFLLLSLLLISSFSYFSLDSASNYILHKIFFTGAAWLIFGTLLLGQHYLDWRGKNITKAILASVCFSFITFMLSPFYGP